MTYTRWSNPALDLLHGSINAGADSIFGFGIDIKYATRFADFRRGPYTTINFKQARRWVTRNVGKRMTQTKSGTAILRGHQ